MDCQCVYSVKLDIFNCFGQLIFKICYEMFLSLPNIGQKNAGQMPKLVEPYIYLAPVTLGVTTALLYSLRYRIIGYLIES